MKTKKPNKDAICQMEFTLNDLIAIGFVLSDWSECRQKKKSLKKEDKFTKNISKHTLYLLERFSDALDAYDNFSCPECSKEQRK
jgi:hypothetical protein